MGEGGILMVNICSATPTFTDHIHFQGYLIMTNLDHVPEHETGARESSEELSSHKEELSMQI